MAVAADIIEKWMLDEGLVGGWNAGNEDPIEDGVYEIQRWYYDGPTTGHTSSTQCWAWWGPAKTDSEDLRGGHIPKGTPQWHGTAGSPERAKRQVSRSVDCYDNMIGWRPVRPEDKEN